MMLNWRANLIPLAILTIAGCASLTSKPRSPAQVYDDPSFSYYEAAKAKPESNLKCSDLIDHLKAKSPRSIESVLKWIQSVRPNYLKNYTLVHESFSLHRTSPEFPRAIVFGGDAKTIITFNGDRKADGFERLEIMCFNDQDKTFEFRDVAFPQEAPSEDRLGDLPTELRRRANVISEVGGTPSRSCAQCHQIPMRPNWDAYPRWPRVYGAFDDHLTNQERISNPPSPFEINEENLFERFEKKSGANSRYRYLGDRESKTPNTDLTHFLSYLNGERIIGDLKRLGSKFESQKYLFAKALFCAPKPTHMLKEIRTEGGSTGFELKLLPAKASASAKSIFMEVYREEANKEAKMNEIGPLPQFEMREYQRAALAEYYRTMFPNINFGQAIVTVAADEVLLIAELKKVMDRLNVDISNWGMQLFGGFSHENGLGGAGKQSLRLILQRPFVKEFLSDNSELANMVLQRESVERAALKNFGDPERFKPLLEFDEKICSLIDKRK